MAQSASSRPPFPRRGVFIALLLLAEVVLLAVLYQMVARIDCLDTDAYSMCRLLRSMVARAFAVFAAAGLLVWARPQAFMRFLHGAQSRADGLPWMAMHLLGLLSMLMPILLVGRGDLSAHFQLAALAWVLGGLAAAAGGALWIARPRDWQALFSDLGGRSALVLVVALLIPDLANTVLPVWDMTAMTALTFQMVCRLLVIAGPETFADPAGYIIGVAGFYVHIARQCSGVEGFALVSGFTLLYWLLFRESVRFWRFWLVVLPLAILLSWALNILRITGLILIGAYISPELAVDGFHSYAGWMLFTLLAMAILFGVQASPWLHHADHAPGKGPRLREDWIAARILPFIVFMLSGLLVAAFFHPAELGYPLRAMAMALVLAFFLPLYRKIEWRADPVALLAGVAVGVGWVLAQPGGSDSGAEMAMVLATLPAAVWLLWAVARIVGTVLLVPVVEELFFRGYVMARIDDGSPLRKAIAVVISTALFALLHGRYLEAGLAGLVFAMVMLRRGRVGDAILAHMAANTIVALAALYKGDWGLI